MMEWWEALTVAERVFAYIAVPATIILILQTILLLFGMGHDGGDADSDHDFGHDMGHDFDHDAGHDFDSGHDFDHDADNDHDGHFTDGFRLFTVRGLVAFFAVMGWAGMSLLENGVGLTLTIFFSLAAGLAAMLLVGVAMYWFYKLQSNGTMELKNTLGASGTVYITVPPNRENPGKVNIMLQGTYTELPAVTDDSEPLKYGTEITVVGISGENTLVIKRK